ncbi:GerAB/ArcD/ProY family transporter [Thermanaerosceptrum fracticalcis]|uniref:GerAB/ArcD/ProY family transporter n=2 Tax=Thermanaerosceptrum fracticalcis TaxID=1712410 RepID=A0A7G6E8G4_THEFR|nr:GerAB/ArcD/ProY family transporter [Thermanaerosceptrum fracticalcis]
MKLEGGKISRSQLTFLITGFTLGSSVILSPGQAAKHDAWLAILAGLGEGLVFALVFTTLAMRFPGKTLVQFNDIIYGPYLGKVISLSYLWFFFHLASLVLRNFGDFFTAIIYPETPMVVFIILVALICASAVRNGIEVISRCSLILISFTAFMILGTTILLLKDMEFVNFLPVFDLPLKEFLKASHAAATFPFGETVAFLMVMAFLNKVKQAKTSTIMALIIAGILLVIAAVRDTAVLGITKNISVYPSYQTVRLIEVGKVITRLEIVVAVNLLAMGFLKISVLYYGTVLGMAQLLNLRSYLPLVFPIGAMMVSLSILQFDSNIENMFFAFNIYPFYSLPFEVGLPLLSLIIAMIREVPKKAKGA